MLRSEGVLVKVCEGVIPWPSPSLLTFTLTVTETLSLNQILSLRLTLTITLSLSMTLARPSKTMEGSACIVPNALAPPLPLVVFVVLFVPLASWLLWRDTIDFQVLLLHSYKVNMYRIVIR
jgi:hypothetical protein